MQKPYLICKYWLYCAVLLILSLNTQTLFASQQTYSVGVVPQHDARQIFTSWNPIIEYLTKITGLQFILASSPDFHTFEKQLTSGKFDFAFANPFQFLEAHVAQGYNAILRDGERRLQGIVVVHKASHYTTPAALQNQNIALPAPNALGASLMVRHEFSMQGITLKPQYVQSHKSVYLQVATGRIPAGGGVQSTFNSQPEAVRKRLKVIYRTQALTPHPIIVHPRIPKTHVKLVVNAFLQLSHDAKGKTILANIPMRKAVLAGMEDYSNISTIDLKSLPR